MYTVKISDKATEDLKRLKKSEPLAFKKAKALIREIANNPRAGTGRPQLKKYGLAGFYSRRITQKHRLVYSIQDQEITVIIVAAYGHYDDR